MGRKAAPKCLYCARNYATKSLTPVEAVNEFDLDLLESEVISLAHDEDINEWSEIVRDALKR